MKSARTICEMKAPSIDFFWNLASASRTKGQYAFPVSIPDVRRPQPSFSVEIHRVTDNRHIGTRIFLQQRTALVVDHILEMNLLSLIGGRIGVPDRIGAPDRHQASNATSNDRKFVPSWKTTPSNSPSPDENHGRSR